MMAETAVKTEYKILSLPCEYVASKKEIENTTVNNLKFKI